MGLTRVALDCMGGDNAPGEIVKGAVEALKEDQGTEVFLVGKKEDIEGVLSTLPCDDIRPRMHIRDAREVIETAEPPVKAINHKKDSSMVVGLRMVKDNEADAFVSAGNSGALLVGGQAVCGRIAGVKRAPFGALIPTEKGVSLLVDSGANVDVRPDQLLSFARMGSVYMKEVMSIPSPTVGIVNVGAEEEKGNALVKETFPLLKEAKDLNFTGSVEARDIPAGGADVIVCDAFVGNVVLKMYEGVAKSMLHALKKGFKSNVFASLGAAMALPSLKKTLKDFDAARYGGAPLLGLKGLVVKTHGSAEAVEVKNTIIQCRVFTENHVTEKLEKALSV